jgi:mRNA-degrading endonuclease RelE of RelBE toxin-antitoxin system/DNA-binding XRE family transcriptional regulator
MGYRLEITFAAAKQLKKLAVAVQKRLRAKLDILIQDPLNSGLDVKKLQGREGYRLRVGDYRVIYDLYHEVLVVQAQEVGHRREMYHSRRRCMSLRTLTENGVQYAVIPMAMFDDLQEAAQELADIAAYDAAKKRNEESFPIALFDRIDAGESPVRVLRQHRKLTLQQLADTAKLSKGYLSQIESGKRVGTVKMQRAIARALGVPLEMVV